MRTGRIPGTQIIIAAKRDQLGLIVKSKKPRPAEVKSLKILEPIRASVMALLLTLVFAELLPCAVSAFWGALGPNPRRLVTPDRDPRDGFAHSWSTLACLAKPAWFRWASCSLPATACWMGAAGLAGTVAWLIWMYHTLGRNLTDTVVTRRDACFVDYGPYRLVRNPMCTGILVLGISLGLGPAIWLLRVAASLLLTVLTLRTCPEEQHLIRRFGAQYRRYSSALGALFPSCRIESSAVLYCGPDGAAGLPNTGHSTHAVVRRALGQFLFALILLADFRNSSLKPSSMRRCRPFLLACRPRRARSLAFRPCRGSRSAARAAHLLFLTPERTRALKAGLCC